MAYEIWHYYITIIITTFMSGMIYRSKFLNEKVKSIDLLFTKINIFLKTMVILKTDLWKDSIHLLESGKTKLVQNFIFFK